MKTVSFIWDFDGTLVESYDAIRQVLILLYDTYEWPMDEDFVFDFIIKESVGELLRRLAAEHDVPFEELLCFFNREQEARDHMINLMPHAKAALQFTQERGIQNFIYTHKGATTKAVLARLGIDQYFTEVTSSANGSIRKPHPEGINYLLDKYEQDKEKVYLFADSILVVEVAEHAVIKSINLNQPDTSINDKIADVSEIITIFGGV